MKMRVAFISLLVGWFVYEFVALATDQPGDTISEIVWRLSDSPLFPFGFGVLCGHFFWPRGV